MQMSLGDMHLEPPDEPDWDGLEERLYYKSHSARVLYRVASDNWEHTDREKLFALLKDKFWIREISGYWGQDEETKISVDAPYCNIELIDLIRSTVDTFLQGDYSEEWFREAEQNALEKLKEHEEDSYRE